MNNKNEKLKEAVGLLKLLSHPVRLSILCNLLSKGEMSVSDIVESEKGNASQSLISQFLGKMRSENLVNSRKDAQNVYYQIKSEEAEKVIQALYEIYCEK